MDFQVGDKVVFKTWEEMKVEYGINLNGNIGCAYDFTSEMEERIDKERVYTIDQIDGDVVILGDFSWWYTISTDMIKHCEENIELETSIYDSILQKDFSEIDKIISSSGVLGSSRRAIYLRIMQLVLLEKEEDHIHIRAFNLSDYYTEDKFRTIISHASGRDDPTIYFIDPIKDEECIISIAGENGYSVIKTHDQCHIFGKGEKYIIASDKHNNYSIACFCEMLCNNLEVSEGIKNQLIEGKIEELYECSLNKVQLLIKKKEEKEFNNNLTQLQEAISNYLVKELEDSLRSAKEYVENLYRRWVDAINDVKKCQGELFSFQFDHTSDKLEGFINALRIDRENVDIIDNSKQNVVLRIRQPFLFFDETKWAKLKDDVIKRRQKAQHVIEAVMEKRCTLMFETSIKMHFSMAGYRSAVSYYGTVKNPSAPPNPHICFYDCWGDNRTPITQYIMNGDYELAYMQIKATLAGVNLEDTAVFPYLFDYFLSGVTDKSWDYYNCKCITDNETGVQMTIKEAEDYYRSQEVNHEEN